ncbi:DUF4270 family protein [Desertivirga brevis]|uniref:DUF4270 family protein n=1 Tax=Desertivirga brevis TaxID=2810310 RepID=UPI001A964292|nr:DUF4270 family protein [Pedobacter sp. SYSU D00873]
MPQTKYYIYSILAAFTIIFASCQKSDLIGIDTGSENGKSEITTSAVDIATVPEDSVITTGLSQHPFGFLKDPVLGETEAKLALAFNLPSSGFSFGKDATIDSVVLVLKYGNELYGDSISNYTIRVAELAEVFPRSASNSTTYYSTKTWQSTGLLGTKELKAFSYGDTIRVQQIVDGARDTTKKFAPHARIQLGAASVFTKLKSALAIDSVTNFGFQKNFKGLYLTLDPGVITNKGALTFFDLASANNFSGLEVYYKNRTSAGALDTNMAVFSTSSGLAASNVIHNHPASVKANEGNVNVSEVYVQPLGGYRAKIKFTELEALKALVAKTAGENKTITINRAELIIPEVGAATPGTGTYLAPAPRLTLYRTDIAGVRQPIPDNAVQMDPRFLPEPLFDGFYGRRKPREYRFVVTSYVQDLLTGRLKEFDTFISPIRANFTGQANINAAANTARRAVLPGKLNPNSKVRLSIVYTQPD